jgi:hypothetical protein
VPIQTNARRCCPFGPPFFAPRRAGRDRIGVFLADDTDWEEIRELDTESYRVLAPKKLTALLDEQAPGSLICPLPGPHRDPGSPRARRPSYMIVRSRRVRSSSARDWQIA